MLCEELHHLCLIAETLPHAAYAAFTKGLISKLLYLMRSTPDISDLLQSLEDMIHSQFIPKLIGKPSPNASERKLFALPPTLGCLGIVNPISMANVE